MDTLAIKYWTRFINIKNFIYDPNAIKRTKQREADEWAICPQSRTISRALGSLTELNQSI